MAVNTSLAPLPANLFGPAQARHLLNRAAFGASPRQAAELVELGPEKSVAKLIEEANVGHFQLPEAPVDPDVIAPPVEQERLEYVRARRAGDQAAVEAFRRMQVMRQRDDRTMHRELQDWWLGWMIDTPRPTQEKLVLLWHSHFATRHRNVRDAFLMYQQNQFLREHAFNFAALAQGIVHDPAMLTFLNNDRNIQRRPNENLSRELMELFTLGEGNYSERDIKEGARALTGYHVNDNAFQFRPNVHDKGTKTILGQRGDFDGDDFVVILLNNRRCADFVAYKLYRYYVADITDDRKEWTAAQKKVIGRLADGLARNNYDLAPVLSDLFLSQHFYNESNVGTMIKSPAQLVAGTIRTLGLPPRDIDALTDAMRMMGQVLFDPPSVAGWDGGRGWVNTSTLFVRQNLCTYLITGKHPTRGRWSRDQVDYDATRLIADLADPTPTVVVNHLVDTLIGEYVTADRRQMLVAFMEQRDNPLSNDSLVGLLVLITAMPEYQLC